MPSLRPSKQTTQNQFPLFQNIGLMQQGHWTLDTESEQDADRKKLKRRAHPATSQTISPTIPDFNKKFKSIYLNIFSYRIG